MHSSKMPQWPAALEVLPAVVICAILILCLVVVITYVIPPSRAGDVIDGLAAPFEQRSIEWDRFVKEHNCKETSLIHNNLLPDRHVYTCADGAKAER